MARLERLIAIGIALLAISCTSDERPARPSSGAGGEGGDPTGGGGSGGGDEIIVLAASDGTIMLDFGIDISGVGSGFVGAVSLPGASGTIELGGALIDAAIYERQPFGSWVLYQSLAVASDRWYVVWHYCNGPDLEWIYYEGTDGTALDFEAATGSCNEIPGPTVAQVSFPAVAMQPPPLIDGFDIDGPAVSLHGAAPGSVTLGTSHTVLAFEHVDCTTMCGTPGWREVHALLWDAPAARACFGIFYLFDNQPQIQLTYALTLPDLSDPAGVTLLDASWSYTP